MNTCTPTHSCDYQISQSANPVAPVWQPKYKRTSGEFDVYSFSLGRTWDALDQMTINLKSAI